ncbi:hypothetical protein MtrunA17_Chr5g0394851 [Medicago truncatula]|uniref:Uncharacterized protein n=1 Tax=Medicago truncatula TaxID=3880 RepID=A0A396HJ31_MEDTR|nr:hypothetical protein MtrunA17_Chr5g0394851 [Medicago truncatula]
MATNYVFNDKKIYGAAAVIPKYSKFAPLSRRFVSTLMPRLSPLFLVTIANGFFPSCCHPNSIIVLLSQTFIIL